eukprot:3646640-Amphidinium_carterae.1
MVEKFAAEECKADRAIVLAAVQQNGRALQFAAEECKGDRSMVLAAVQQNGDALNCSAEGCKADRAMVLAAVQQNPPAICSASDELLLDSTFAPKAKQPWYILKVSMLSGRSIVVMASGDEGWAYHILERCCSRLQIQKTATPTLLHGTEVVPATVQVRSWPGLRPKGEVSEYQLVVGA